MGNGQGQAQSKRQIIFEGFGLGLSVLKPLVLIYVMLTALAVIGDLITPHKLPATPADVIPTTTVVVMVVLQLIGLVIGLWAATLILVRMMDRALGRQRSMRAAMRHSVRRALPMFVAYCLLTFSVNLGLILLILPGLYIGPRLALAAVAAAGDEYGPLRAMARSWRLTRGHWWRSAIVLSVSTLPVLIVGVVGIAVMMVLMPAPEDDVRLIASWPIRLFSYAFSFLSGAGLGLGAGVAVRLYADLVARAPEKGTSAQPV